MHILLQIAAVVSLTAYLLEQRAVFIRRKKQSWESIVARLRLDWSARELSDMSLLGEERRIGLGQRWKRIFGACGLWAMYRNTGVMMELAGYALDRCEGVDPALIASLSGDAMRIRLWVLRSVARFAFRSAQDAVCMSALRAESAYLEMEWRLRECLEGGAPQMAAGFAGAM